MVAKKRWANGRRLSTSDSLEVGQGACVFVSHHVFQGLLHELDLPERGLAGELLCLLGNQVWKSLVFGGILVGRVEDSLDLDVSEALVEVDR